MSPAASTPGRSCFIRNMRLLLYTLQAKYDLYLITKRPLHEVHAKITALDAKVRLAAATNLPLHPLAFGPSLDLQRQGLCNAVQSEFASNFVGIAASFNFLALEDHHGKLLGIEKVRTLEVLVTLSIFGVHALDRDRYLDRA